MSKKILSTQILLKNATEAEWEAKEAETDIIPARGELYIYNADDTYAAPRLKVGDGTTKLSDLPFVAATVN